MFAPRPQVAIAEMLRVLKPGGRIAFSTWPPELFTGKMFALVAKYLPPPPGAAPPSQWGDPNVVRERLGDATTNIAFDRDVMITPALSPRHGREFFERTAGPLVKLVQSLQADPDRLRQYRTEIESLIAEFFEGNRLKQHFLMSRGIKRTS
jgi:SAM-dependent methyltransferase